MDVNHAHVGFLLSVRMPYDTAEVGKGARSETSHVAGYCSSLNGPVTNFDWILVLLQKSG